MGNASRYTDLDLDICYAVFRLDRTADPKEVARAYRSLAKEFHPDRNENGSRQFVAINQAYLRIKQYLDSKKTTKASLEDIFEEEPDNEMSEFENADEFKVTEKDIAQDSDAVYSQKKDDPSFVQVPYGIQRCCGEELDFDKHPFKGKYLEGNRARCTKCDTEYHRKKGSSVVYVIKKDCRGVCGNCGQVLKIIKKRVYKKIGFIPTKKVLRKEMIPYCSRCEEKPVFKK